MYMEYEEEERGDLKEATQYLELRNRLKESIRRKNMKNDDSHTSQKINDSPYNGSFFGQSQHSLAKRVIEQHKDLKQVNIEQASSKAKKVELLKRSRDYSFLSSDDHVPTTIQLKNKCGKSAVIESFVSTQEKKSVGSPMKLKRMPIESLESSILKKHVRSMNLQGKRIDSTRPKKKIVRSSNNEDDEAISIIRDMFNTKRFVGRDDRDVRGMESKFGDILKEEKRSERLASKEDAEQLRLIEEEQQNKRKLPPSKKRCV